MKLKKLTLSALLFASLVSVTTSCAKYNGNDGTQDNTQKKDDDNNLTLDASLYTSTGHRRLSEETEVEIAKWVADIIMDKGAELITGGLSTYGKTLVLNLLKECGLDLRDANTKSLERIEKQLEVLDNKLNAIAQQIEKEHSESVLSNVLERVSDTLENYSSYTVKGMQLLIDLEKDESISEADLEAKREQYYHDAIENLLINGLPIANEVINLADSILQPNRASGNSIFYYYFNTIASTDVWSIQRMKNIKSFMAYIDSVLILTSNIAKFQMYYLAKDKGEIARGVYKDLMDRMAEKVNAVNLLFKNQLIAMQEYEDKASEGINIYLPTNKEYSTRVATLTYNPYEEDVSATDSRAALLLGFNNWNRDDLGRYCFKYNPDQTTVNGVAQSFREYATSYCTKDYTIQDYLTYCGFSANNEELYKNAAGLYKGDFNYTDYGYLNDDHDYNIGYYNQRCEYATKKVYEVATYHKNLFEIDYADLRITDQSYYICFTTKLYNSDYLDGSYSAQFMNDWCWKVFNACPYKYNYYNIPSMKFVLNNSW